MFKNVIGFGLVGVMLLACFAGIASAEVSYAKTYTDPSGDVENDDADILEMKSAPSGDNILFTMKVTGTARANATYSITLNVDGETGSIVHSFGMTIYTNKAANITDIGVNLTVSGNTATFTIPKSDINAKTLFDISSAYIVDAECSNMDTITCGAAPADDDDDTSDDDTTTDDDVDDDVDDDSDDDIAIDDDYEYKEYDYPETHDPAKDTATDSTIGVDIGDFTFDYKETGTNVEMTWKLTGKTSGKVDHCAITFVTYYDDGTHDNVTWTVGDFEYNFGGQFYFKGTGPDGKTDWSKWEYYMHYSGPKDNETSTDKNDTKKIKSIVFYVRAFSDAAQKKWGQDSKDVTGTIKAKAPDYADSTFVDEPAEKKSPGFEFIFVMAAAAVVGIVFWIRRKY